MTSLDILGLIATCFTTSSFVPQVWRTWRTRDVSGISLASYAVITVGLALWLVYGLALAAWPIVAANAVTLALAGTILCMKLRYGARGTG